MKNKLYLIFFMTFFTLTVFGDPTPCPEEKSLAEKIESSLSEDKCSKNLLEAILYKEASDEAKVSAKSAYSSLCKLENEFTSVCIVMGKDGAIENSVLAKTCASANKFTPMCLLMAVSKKKTSEEIISLCSKASEDSIKNM